LTTASGKLAPPIAAATTTSKPPVASTATRRGASGVRRASNAASPSPPRHKTYQMRHAMTYKDEAADRLGELPLYRPRCSEEP
jgi:hypothetical protein